MTETERWLKNLSDALPQIDGLAVDETLRKTLWRACSEAYIEAEERHDFAYVHRNSMNKWTKEDTETISNALKSAEDCKSYNEEDNVLEMLARRLGRPQKSVKKKAIELGFARKVDYWMNEKND